MQNRTQSSRWKYCVFLWIGNDWTEPDVLKGVSEYYIHVILAVLLLQIPVWVAILLADLVLDQSQIWNKQLISADRNRMSRLELSVGKQLVCYHLNVAPVCNLKFSFVVGLFAVFYFPSCLPRINLMQIYMSSFNSKLKCSCCYLYHDGSSH